MAGSRGAKRKLEAASPKKAASPPPEPAPRKRKAAATAAAAASAAPSEAAELGPLARPFLPREPGTLYAIGQGDFGQLGLGPDVSEKKRPGPLGLFPGGSRVIAMACGGMHTVAVTEAGAVYTWGVNDEKALGREVVDADDCTRPGLVAGPLADQRVVACSAGDSHTAVLTEAGAVYGWGTYREDGPMGFVPGVKLQAAPLLLLAATRGQRIVAIASGADHTLAVGEDGHVRTWGNGLQGRLGRVGERVSERAKLDLFLTPARVLLPRGAGKAVYAACGAYHSFVLTSTDKVYAWGLNNWGQLGLPRGEPSYKPSLVASLCGQGIRQMAGGQHHSLALAGGPRVLSWGRTVYGQLGRTVEMDGPPGQLRPKDASEHSPAPVEGLEAAGGAVAVAAKMDVSGVGAASGDAYLWGCGVNGQLGKGDDDDDEFLPRKVAQTKAYQGQRVLQLDFGGQHTMLLCADKPQVADGAAAGGSLPVKA